MNICVCTRLGSVSKTFGAQTEYAVLLVLVGLKFVALWRFTRIHVISQRILCALHYWRIIKCFYRSVSQVLGIAENAYNYMITISNFIIALPTEILALFAKKSDSQLLQNM